ncbi:uncharacterized protein FIBRA_03951 [Fibroporia radiculosa]|uniref:AB hydrolase-1 domain-containing protein n=1 Tax=Fibroporia radiculosa TaxID=599839 RepID=J4GNU4_9APHY|nr:uncharacterized protein FIBRA_03951 [Fibroporia radiculosa]CCM01880.1 predicted protein [Fibroporia radiculosa]
MTTPTSEGFAPYLVPAARKPCQTYYKIFGDLTSGITPLIAIHGGPSVGHSYFMVLEDLTSAYGTPVVLYDQVGCGKSTHIQEKNGDVDFWTPQFFQDEFHNLRKHLGIEEYNVLGHSWGAMLGMMIATHQPQGLRRLVLASGPAAMDDWVQTQRRLLRTLSEGVQACIRTISECTSAGTTASPEYQAAFFEYLKSCLCRVVPFPQELQDGIEELQKDPTVCATLLGLDDFEVTGSMKDWSIVSELHRIKVPTLLVNGAFDQAQDSVLAPIFREIPKVKWYTFSQSAHMAHLEERTKYREIVGEFLTQCE